jgi:hypothetical protein
MSAHYALFAIALCDYGRSRMRILFFQRSDREGRNRRASPCRSSVMLTLVFPARLGFIAWALRAEAGLLAWERGNAFSCKKPGNDG